jgi:AcrR family transcriptional regulator
MTTPKKRPAHRPSRRTAVVEAAMQLFASSSSETITVAEIADAAGMTSAAVYYHFASKDDILLEGLRAVGEGVVAETRRLQQEVSAGSATLGDLLVGLLSWLDDRKDQARVWFVTSSGVSLAVEQLRRELRGELMAVLTRAVKAARPGVGAAEGAVIAVALLSLLETAAASWLTDDESVEGLGRAGFLDETALLAERVAGP